MKRPVALLLLLSFGCTPRGGDTAIPDPASLHEAPVPGTSADDQLPSVRVNGVDLHYVEEGVGDPVVFVHGSLEDYREWQSVGDQLTGSYRTLRYSRRYNFPNENPLVGADHSAAVEAEDLAALIRAKGLTPAHVVGVSYGGYTGLLLALRHPDLVRSLVVVEPPIMQWVPALPGGVDVATKFFDGMWRPAGEAFRRGDRDGALRVSLDYFAFPGAMDSLPPEFLGEIRSNLREWEALTTSSNPFPAVSREELGSLRVPVLVLSGELGFEGTRLTDPELARAIPRGERLVIPEGTHDVCSEQPAACAEAIRAFLGRR